MTQMLDPVETRIVAIMESAYDPSSSGRVLTLKRFRRSIQNAPLRDPSYPINAMDRAYELEWSSTEDFPEAVNPIDAYAELQVYLNLNVGYVYGKNAGSDLSAFGSESTSVTVFHCRKRALSDAEAIKRCLTYGPTFSSANISSTNIGWTSCQRVGATTLQDLGAGRMIAVSKYALIITYNPADDHAP